MRNTLIVVIVVLVAMGCSKDRIINDPSLKGPDVLLSDDFNKALDREIWELTDMCGGLSKPDGKGNLTLMSCDYPAWVTSWLLSQQEWMIEPGERYTATLRIGTPDCLSWGAGLWWGLLCYSGDTLLGDLGFCAGLGDVYGVFIEYRKLFDPCRGSSEQGTDVCGEFHDYTLVISDTKIEAFIGDVLQNRIDLVGECEGHIDSFKIGVSVSTQHDQNKVLIDKITLERSRIE